MPSNRPSGGPARRLLITAGPTHEPLDEVRYLANRSSGRLGIALAIAAASRGHSTTLLLGPVAMAAPEHSALAVYRFRTTDDLREALARAWPRHDVLIMAAAVADYRPARLLAEEGNRHGRARGTRKIERGERPISLELEPTPDLVAELAARSRPDQIRIGFALEPAESLAEAAQRKLRMKGLHAIVANPLESMDSETISATLHLPAGEWIAAPPNIAKRDFAEWLLDRLPQIEAAASS